MTGISNGGRLRPESSSGAYVDGKVDCRRNSLRGLASLLFSQHMVMQRRSFNDQNDADTRLLPQHFRNRADAHRPVTMEVVSPFDSSSSPAAAMDTTGPLALTIENVELVLDEMRPYLMADGGNVAVVELDGPTVKLELQGACGSCSASAMTLKMGLEKGLREKIPEIFEVIQVVPDGEELSEEGVEGVLAEIRPFLKIGGGSIELVDLQIAGIVPTATLAIRGASSTVNSVRAEIIQRLRNKFPMLGIKWDDQIE